MALIQCPSSSLTTKPYYHRLPHAPPLLHFPTRTHFTVRSQTPSEPSKPAAEATQVPPKKPTSAGTGFGPPPPSSAKPNSAADKKKGRAAVIRRSPVEKPLLYSEEDEAKAKEMGTNESAFVLAWLGLGGVILAQGLLLAASGFLPEEWDKFLVKYLYPSFTPTVGLFVAGSVVYGVVKYLQNEELKGFTRGLSSSHVKRLSDDDVMREIKRVVDEPRIAKFSSSLGVIAPKEPTI